MPPGTNSLGYGPAMGDSPLVKNWGWCNWGWSMIVIVACGGLVVKLVVYDVSPIAKIRFCCFDIHLSSVGS